MYISLFIYRGADPPIKSAWRPPGLIKYIPSDTVSILNAYLKHSISRNKYINAYLTHPINHDKYIKCIFKTFHQSSYNIWNVYLKHSISHNKYIKCIFKTFHQSSYKYIWDPGPAVDPGPAGTRARRGPAGLLAHRLPQVATGCHRSCVKPLGRI